MSDANTPKVEGAVTDAVTQTNVQVLGEAPAMAVGTLYQTIGNAVAMAAANAVYAQQQANVTYQSATTVAVKALLDSSNEASAADLLEAGGISNGDSLEKRVAELEEQLEELKNRSKNAEKKGR